MWCMYIIYIIQYERNSYTCEQEGVYKDAHCSIINNCKNLNITWMSINRDNSILSKVYYIYYTVLYCTVLYYTIHLSHPSNYIYSIAYTMTYYIYYWNRTDFATPKCATLACILFWTESNRDLADSGKTFTCPLTT